MMSMMLGSISSRRAPSKHAQASSLPKERPAFKYVCVRAVETRDPVLLSPSLLSGSKACQYFETNAMQRHSLQKKPPSTRHTATEFARLCQGAPLMQTIDLSATQMRSPHPDRRHQHRHPELSRYQRIAAAGVSSPQAPWSDQC